MYKTAKDVVQPKTTALTCVMTIAILALGLVLAGPTPAFGTSLSPSPTTRLANTGKNSGGTIRYSDITFVMPEPWRDELETRMDSDRNACKITWSDENAWIELSRHTAHKPTKNEAHYDDLEFVEQKKLSNGNTAMIYAGEDREYAVRVQTPKDGEAMLRTNLYSVLFYMPEKGTQLRESMREVADDSSTTSDPTLTIACLYKCAENISFVGKMANNFPDFRGTYSSEGSAVTTGSAKGGTSYASYIRELQVIEQNNYSVVINMSYINYHMAIPCSVEHVTVKLNNSFEGDFTYDDDGWGNAGKVHLRFSYDTSKVYVSGSRTKRGRRNVGVLATEEETTLYHESSPNRESSLPNRWYGKYQGLFRREDGSEYEQTRRTMLVLDEINADGTVEGIMYVDSYSLDDESGLQFYVEGTFDSDTRVIDVHWTEWHHNDGTLSKRRFWGKVSSDYTRIDGQTTTLDGEHWSNWDSEAE